MIAHVGTNEDKICLSVQNEVFTQQTNKMHAYFMDTVVASISSSYKPTPLLSSEVLLTLVSTQISIKKDLADES